MFSIAVPVLAESTTTDARVLKVYQNSYIWVDNNFSKSKLDPSTVVNTVCQMMIPAIPGIFSVSSDKKVRFMLGNLQAEYNGSSYTWDFAANQYDYIGNTWRTLSNDEWIYLFNTRTVNGGTGAGKSYSLNIIYGGKMGIVLYPDNYTGSVLSGTVATLPEGVVFLPAAGYRTSSVRVRYQGYNVRLVTEK